MLIVMLEFVPMFSVPKYFLKNVMYSISHVENLCFFLKKGNEQGGGEGGCLYSSASRTVFLTQLQDYSEETACHHDMEPPPFAFGVD